MFRTFDTEGLRFWSRFAYLHVSKFNSAVGVFTQASSLSKEMLALEKQNHGSNPQRHTNYKTNKTTKVKKAKKKQQTSKNVKHTRRQQVHPSIGSPVFKCLSTSTSTNLKPLRLPQCLGAEAATATVKRP